MILYLSTVHSILIRREMVVAQSDGFSEIIVARSGGFRGDWRICVTVCVCFSQNKIRHFLSSVSSLRASVVAYSKTDQYVFITQKRNSCVLGSLANNTEYSFSISSREGHEVSNITLTQSPNAAADQLDIF